MADPLIELAKDLGNVESSAAKAHERIDRVENQVLVDLKDLRTKLGSIEAWMHKTQGAGSALFVVGSVVGAVVSWLLTYLMKGG